MKKGILAASFRSFTLQASWTNERLQGLGAAVVSEPLLRDLDGGPTGDRYAQAVGRSARSFNAHPFLAGLALGALARAEHDRLSPEQILKVRKALKGPLGAIGDRLIWAGVLPVASAVGIVLAALHHPIVAVVTFLVVFNLVHLPLRFWGVAAGWRHGIRMAAALQNRTLQTLLRVVGPLAIVGAGFALPIAADWVINPLEAPARLGVFGIAAATAVTALWLLPRLGAVRLGLSALGLALVVGWIW